MNKILICVDMQNDFVDGVLGTEEARQVAFSIKDKVERVLKENGFVFFTQDTHDKNYLSTEEGKNLPIPHCIEGTSGWEIIAPLQDLMRQYDNWSIICKNTFGAEFLIETLQQLREIADSRINEFEIELIGVCTDMCVISNAIIAKTALPELHISVDASCCAGTTPEAHNCALEVIKGLQIEVKNI